MRCFMIPLYTIIFGWSNTVQSVWLRMQRVRNKVTCIQIFVVNLEKKFPFDRPLCRHRNYTETPKTHKHIYIYTYIFLCVFVIVQKGASEIYGKSVLQNTVSISRKESQNMLINLRTDDKFKNQPNIPYFIFFGAKTELQLTRDKKSD